MAEQRPVPQDTYSGLQAVETGPQVVEPRPGLSQNRTWEQTSSLPEHVPPQAPLEHDPYKLSPGYPPGHPGSYASTLSVPYTGTATPDPNYQPGPPAGAFAQEKAPDRRLCGLRKHVFWIVFAVLMFAVVAAVAIGVGVGLGTRRHSGGDSSPSNATASGNATATASNTLPTPSATATGGAEVGIACPADNRTLYDVAASAETATAKSRRFLLLCGRDYNSQQGAVDLFTRNTTTFAECLAACARWGACTAVGWGNYYGTNTCWLKSSIGKPNWSSDWITAVEDEGSS